MASSPCENLPGIEFSNGSIELDLKGKEIQGASFIGVAFHGVGRSSPARDARAPWRDYIWAHYRWDVILAKYEKMFAKLRSGGSGRR